jgi:ribosomal-protein-alanine N-acetyltransferase
MTPALHVELAQPGDAAAIAVMSRNLIEHGLPWNWQPVRVARAISSASTNVAVLRGRAGLVGFGIMEYWDEDAHLVLLAVLPGQQRKGIGSAILNWLEASATAAGSKRIRAEARRDNEAARNLYNEHGYHEAAIKSRMYSGALDGIRLEKWLRVASD